MKAVRSTRLTRKLDYDFASGLKIGSAATTTMPTSTPTENNFVR